MEENTSPMIEDIGETKIVGAPATEIINIESVPDIITVEVPEDNDKPISPDANVTNSVADPAHMSAPIADDEVLLDGVKVPVVVPTIESVSTIATHAVESTTQSQTVMMNHVTNMTPSVSSVIPSLLQAQTVPVTAPTSASRQIQHQEQVQQNLSNAQDWDASDIENKLAENAAMLSQWTSLLDKNGM